MSETGTAPAVAAPALVVFGLDDKGKAHASWFDPTEIELATKAAGLMGMATLAVTTDEHRALAASLPRGRVFASGRAFVPFAKTALYGRLKAFGGHNQKDRKAKADNGAAAGAATNDAVPREPEAPASQETEPAHLPSNWDEIRIGSLVLAPEHDDLSWWPAIVAKVEGEDRYTLKWRDFADEDAFVRGLHQLGLLNPDGTERARVSPLDEQPIGEAAVFDTERLPTWSEVQVGSVVLASDGPMQGWFEAVAAEVKDDLYVLRWRDFEDRPSFVRRREHLILFPIVVQPA